MEHDDLGDVQVTATYEQWQDFLTSAIWLDMKTEIACWAEMIRGSLGNSDKPRELFRMQGRLEVCENVLELPNNMLAILIDRYEKAAALKNDITSLDYSSSDDTLNSIL